jgi:hypothetical protein
MISQVLCVDIGFDYESIARLWLCNKKHGVTNIVTSAVFWCIWKLRNAMIFQGVAWTGLKLLWQRIVSMLRCWRILAPLAMEPGFESVVSQLEQVLTVPELINTG